MRTSSLFRLTSFGVLVQIALGGLVTFNFIGLLWHIAAGAGVSALALATVIAALRAKFTHRQLKQVSASLIAALAVQVILGFGTAASGIDLLSWIHLVLAVLIYAMALTGMFLASQQELMFSASNTGGATETTTQDVASPPGPPLTRSVILLGLIEILTGATFTLGGIALLTFASNPANVPYLFVAAHFPIAASFLALGVASLVSTNKRAWSLGLLVVIVSVVDDLVAFLFPLPRAGVIGTTLVLLAALITGYFLLRPDVRSFFRS